MPTSSIFRSISVKTVKECESFAKALEEAENSSIEKHIPSVPAKFLSQEEINKYFSDEK